MKRFKWWRALSLLGLQSLLGCSSNLGSDDRVGCLVYSTGSALRCLDLSSGQRTVIDDIGASGGPPSGVELLLGRYLVYSRSPLSGPNQVVVRDLQTNTITAVRSGVHGAIANDDSSVVYWRVVGLRAELVWWTLNGDSGVVMSGNASNASDLIAPVGVRATGVVFVSGDSLMLYDARARRTRSIGGRGLVPLCETPSGWLLCHRGSTDTLIALELAGDGDHIRQLGTVQAVGWATDRLNGRLYCAVPASVVPESYDLAEFDEETGQVRRIRRDLVLSGGAVIECSRVPIPTVRPAQESSQ